MERCPFVCLKGSRIDGPAFLRHDSDPSGWHLYQSSAGASPPPPPPPPLPGCSSTFVSSGVRRRAPAGAVCSAAIGAHPQPPAVGQSQLTSGRRDLLLRDYCGKIDFGEEEGDA